MSLTGRDSDGDGESDIIYPDLFWGPIWQNHVKHREGKIRQGTKHQDVDGFDVRTVDAGSIIR